MKLARSLVLLAFCLNCGFLVAQDKKETNQEPEKEYSKVLPNPAFEKIKALQGEWVGTGEGTQTTMRFQVMSAGSSVLLIMNGDKPGDEMVTVFHPDGERLLMTHYCSAKNQPRMKLVPGGDANVLRFEFLDATNLADPKIGHMVGLKMKLLDVDHHVQEWTFQEDGKDQTTAFDMHRKT